MEWRTAPSCPWRSSEACLPFSNLALKCRIVRRVREDAEYRRLWVPILIQTGEGSEDSRYQREFNPDFFLRVKGTHDILVVEVKSDGGDWNRVRAKSRDGVAVPPHC
jgi:hypothetical protein